MRTKNWRGYYWARRTEKGNYEIRNVPSSLGEWINAAYNFLGHFPENRVTSHGAVLFCLFT